MPSYSVEREYLLPVYQRVIVVAKNPAQACRLARDEGDWEGVNVKFDEIGSGPSYIAAVVPGTDTDALGNRNERELFGPTCVPYQHRGGLRLVDEVADEIAAEIKQMIDEEGPPELVKQLYKWHSLLRQVITYALPEATP